VEHGEDNTTGEVETTSWSSSPTAGPGAEVHGAPAGTPRAATPAVGAVPGASGAAYPSYPYPGLPAAAPGQPWPVAGAEGPTAPVWRPAAPAGGPGWPGPTGAVPSGPGSDAEPGPSSSLASSRRRRGWPAVAVVAALVGGATGAAVTAVIGTGTGNGTANDAVKVGQETPGPALAGGAQIPTIVRSVLPEVVSIDAKGPGTSVGGLFATGPTEDQGTGMIITSSGEVLTNNHVISGATTITVTLYGQTKALPATLVGADPTQDVALLRIDSPPADLQAVTFGSSQQLQVGDAVIAVGNALGLSAGTPTVTSGIVSALDRTVQAGDAQGGVAETLQNMIQTDAAINSGNSGGPLVDSAGQVVGMNTAVASTADGNAPAQNIGFAITSSTIQGLLPTLRSGGTAGVAKPFLGVEVADETAQEQADYGLVPSTGALVVSVVSGSPADAAGIEPGDVIVAFDGKTVSTAQDLTNLVQAASAGQAAQITLWRGSQRFTVTATLTPTPAG